MNDYMEGKVFEHTEFDIPDPGYERLDEAAKIITDPNKIPGFKQTTNFDPNYAANGTTKKKKRTISSFFSNLSRWGMNYEDDVINNMRAIPADKNLIPKQDQLLMQDLFANSNWKQKTNKDRSFFEKDFNVKRDTLRKLSLQPELEDILDTMANEMIVYDSNYTYFLEPYLDANESKDLDKKVDEQLRKDMSTWFARIYKMLNWKTRGWDDCKRWLIEGELAWEIVYDSLEKPTKIIGMVPLDVATLTRKFDNGKWYWIQYKDVMGKERKLLDVQVVYIQFQDTECVSRISYLERLIRPFNIYRIVEQAQLIWTITNAQMKMKFVIPTANMDKKQAAQTVSTAMNRYRESIKLNGDDGTLSINGQSNIPGTKEYWLASGDAGTPEIETIGGEGPDLNDGDQLKYHKNQLYKISKIPLDRFDQESGSTWFGTDASSVARAEISFGRYVDRMRNTFAQIILKPLQIQMMLCQPSLMEYKEIVSAISLQYKSYNLFEEMMELEMMQKRVEHIQTMKESMVDMDPEGNDVKFFSSEFLVKKYLKMSDADIDLNNKMKQKEMKELNLAGDENSIDYESKRDELANLLEEIKKEKTSLKKEKEDLAKKKPKSKNEEE